MPQAKLISTSFQDGPKDQTRNLEIPDSLVSLAPRNDGFQKTGSVGK